MAKVVIGEFVRQPDPKPVGALIRAHRWLGALRQGADLGRLARDAGISAGCLRGHLQLAFLAPEIQSAILDGTQPEHLTLHSLTRPEMPPVLGDAYSCSDLRRAPEIGEDLRRPCKRLRLGFVRPDERARSLVCSKACFGGYDGRCGASERKQPD